MGISAFSAVAYGRVAVKYVLITFTPVSPGDSETRYYIYGHEYCGKNEQLAICENRIEAMEEAHRWKGVPVFEGQAYALVLTKLSE